MEQQKLNPAIIYVLSILGLLCCCLAGSGVIPSVIAFFMAKSNLKKVEADPESFDVSNIKQMNTAKIVALVVIIINILMIIRVIYVIATVGWDELTSQIMKSYEEALKAQGQ